MAIETINRRTAPRISEFRRDRQPALARSLQDFQQVLDQLAELTQRLGLTLQRPYEGKSMAYMPKGANTGLVKRFLAGWVFPAQEEQAPREETLMVDHWGLGVDEVRAAVTFIVRGQNETTNALNRFFLLQGLIAERSFTTGSSQDCTAYSLIMPSLEGMEVDEGRVH